DKPDPTISALRTDDVLGAELAARHLVELGHRDFAILALEFSGVDFGFASEAQIKGGVFATARDRVAGYRKVLREAGIDTATVPVFETLNEPQSVIAGLEAIFAGKRPTA